MVKHVYFGARRPGSKAQLYGLCLSSLSINENDNSTVTINLKNLTTPGLPIANVSYYMVRQEDLQLALKRKGGEQMK